VLPRVLYFHCSHNLNLPKYFNRARLNLIVPDLNLIVENMPIRGRYNFRPYTLARRAGGARSRTFRALGTLSRRAGVQYAGRMATYRARASLAGAAALGAYGIYKGVKRVRRARARVKARRQAGLTKIGRPSKRFNIIDQANSTINDLTWSATDLCTLPITSDPQVINARSSRWATITGWRHKCVWENLSDEHVAVYQVWFVPKQYEQAMSDAKLQREFFNKDGLSPTDEDDNWASTLSYMFMDRQINSQKFSVVMKKKTILGPRRDDAVSKAASNYPALKIEQMWIPCKRKFTYEAVAEDGVGTDRSEQPTIFYVNWVVRVGQNTGGTPQATVKRNLQVITFFRDGGS